MKKPADEVPLDGVLGCGALIAGVALLAALVGLGMLFFAMGWDVFRHAVLQWR